MFILILVLLCTVWWVYGQKVDSQHFLTQWGHIRFEIALFFFKLVFDTKIIQYQDVRTTFKQTLACIFLSVNTIQFNSIEKARFNMRRSVIWCLFIVTFTHFVHQIISVTIFLVQLEQEINPMVYFYATSYFMHQPFEYLLPMKWDYVHSSLFNSFSEQYYWGSRSKWKSLRTKPVRGKYEMFDSTKFWKICDIVQMPTRSVL